MAAASDGCVLGAAFLGVLFFFAFLPTSDTRSDRISPDPHPLHVHLPGKFRIGEIVAHPTVGGSRHPLLPCPPGVLSKGGHCLGSRRNL